MRAPPGVHSDGYSNNYNNNYNQFSPYASNTQLSSASPDYTLSTAFQSRASNQTFNPIVPPVQSTAFSLEAAQHQKSTQRPKRLSLTYVDETLKREKKHGPFTTTQWILVVGFVALIVVVGAVIPIALSGDEANGEDPTCGSAAEDERIRGIIADNLVFGGVNGPIISNVELNCLPSNAFARISAADKVQFFAEAVLTIKGCAITAIKPNAFNENFFANIQILAITFNGITSLPEGIFTPFPALTTLDFSNSAFAKIDNKPFSSNPLLTQVVFSGCAGLVELPGDLKNVANLNTVACAFCSSLLKVEDNFFAGKTMTRVDVSNTLIPEVLSLQQFIDKTGINDDAEIDGFV